VSRVAPIDPTPVDAPRDSARGGEPDRYIAALLAPAAARPGLMALAAFAADVGRIATQVREPMMGDIRLQWWRDALAHGADGQRTGHPVADALIDTITRHALPREPFERLLEARGLDLAGDCFADDAALEDYLAATEGLVFALGVSILTRPQTAAHPALRAAGVAYGLARGLGRLPASLAHGGFLLPRSRLHEAGVTLEALEQRPVTPATEAAADMIARGLEVRARAALEQASAELANMDRAALAALLPLAMVEPYFAAQNRKGYRRLTQVAEPAPLTRVWRLWRGYRRGRI
jgi:15-cis-phytoene synthase